MSIPGIPRPLRNARLECAQRAKSGQLISPRDRAVPPIGGTTSRAAMTRSSAGRSWSKDGDWRPDCRTDRGRAARRRRSVALAPWRARKSGLTGNHIIRPNDHLCPVLPLNGDRLVRRLEPTLIDRKVAKHRLRPEGQQRLAQLVGIEAPRPAHRVGQELARSVRASRLHGGRAFELALIGGDELRVSRVLQARLPKRAAVNELCVLTELLVVIR